MLNERFKNLDNLLNLKGFEFNPDLVNELTALVNEFQETNKE